MGLNQEEQVDEFCDEDQDAYDLLLKLFPIEEELPEVGDWESTDNDLESDTDSEPDNEEIYGSHCSHEGM